jgi:uncharacterized membrane-anchored protein
MKNKSIYLILFIAVVIAQWLIPIVMISHQEDTLSTGKIFKFKTEPVDPYDAFRGKYISLRFKEDRAKINKETKKLNYGDAIFVTFIDSSGYALVDAVLVREPKDTQIYVKAKVSYVDNSILLNSKVKQPRFSIHINYPFERYYMNETKAPMAETAYRENNQQTKDNVYAQVAIKNGVGIVKDVIIDGVPIKDYVKK